MQINGIDVSKYQGQIDWNAVKASGVKFAMLRAVSTNSKGLYIDPTFERNYKECKRVGVPCGLYYYTYAQSKERVNQELALVKQVMAGKTFEMPIAVDVEENKLKPLSRAALTDLVQYALDTIESWNCYAILYTYTYYKQTELDMNRLAKYDMWIADYRGTRPGFANGMWQYSSKGQVSGISGSCDMNYAYRDYPTIIKNAGLNGFGKNPVPAKKYMYTISVGEISEGDYKAVEADLKDTLDSRQLNQYYKVEKREI